MNNTETTQPYEQEFFDFLKSHEALDDYIEEVQVWLYGEEFELPDRPSTYISGPFVWQKSHLGQDYWSNLSWKWIYQLKTLQEND